MVGPQTLRAILPIRAMAYLLPVGRGDRIRTSQGRDGR